jgi:DNA-binding protein Fis
VTAHAFKGDRERCLAAGMDAYLSKPLRGQDLSRVIDDLLNERLAASSRDLYAEVLDLTERHLISQVLQHTNGNQVRAAEVLGIARNSLRKQIRSPGITIGRVVSREDSETGPDEEDWPGRIRTTGERRPEVIRD